MTLTTIKETGYRDCNLYYQFNFQS